MPAMQAIGRRRDPAANRKNLSERQWQVAESRCARTPGDEFEDQVGDIEIAAEYPVWNMNAGEPQHDHLFDLERDDGGWIFTVPQRWNFHHPGRIAFERADAPQARHAPDVNTFVNRESANGLPDIET